MAPSALFTIQYMVVID